MVGYGYKPSDYPTANVSSYVIEESRLKGATLNIPKASKWQCTLIGGPNGAVYNPSEGNEPNWFHRKMQELCFGFKWRKSK